MRLSPFTAALLASTFLAASAGAQTVVSGTSLSISGTTSSEASALTSNLVSNDGTTSDQVIGASSANPIIFNSFASVLHQTGANSNSSGYNTGYAAIGGYVWNDTAQASNIGPTTKGNAVALYGNSLCRVSGAVCWGSNPIAGNLSTSTTNGGALSGGALIGEEVDVDNEVANASGNGVLITGNSTVPATGIGFTAISVALLDEGYGWDGTGTNPVTWAYGLYVAPGAAAVAADFGTISETLNGASSNGMPIVYEYGNSTGNFKNYVEQATPSAFDFTCTEAACGWSFAGSLSSTGAASIGGNLTAASATVSGGETVGSLTTAGGVTVSSAGFLSVSGPTYLVGSVALGSVSLSVGGSPTVTSASLAVSSTCNLNILQGLIIGYSAGC